MNMHDGMAGAVAQSSAMDLIVGLAALFAVVFFAAWLLSPRLRAWVERPKYRFQANVRSYDETQGARLAPEPRSPR
jgi:flagellar biogenesis protein FliO